MDGGGKKRAREGEEMENLAKKVAKKPDVTDELETKTDFDFFNEFNFMPHGVFDFPWLKEGAIFKLEDCFQFEDSFEHVSKLGKTSTSSAVTGVEFFKQENFFQCPEEKIYKDILSFRANEFDGADWIWSSGLDQQSLGNGLNKVV